MSCEAPLSMKFSRQGYWVGSHSLLQGIFLTQVLNPVSCVSCIVRKFFTTKPPGSPFLYYLHQKPTPADLIVYFQIQNPKIFILI